MKIARIKIVGFAFLFMLLSAILFNQLFDFWIVMLVMAPTGWIVGIWIAHRFGWR